MIPPFCRSALLALGIACAAWGCGAEDGQVAPPPPPPAARFKIKLLIDRLSDKDAAVRSAAKDQLMGMAAQGFSPKDAARLLLAAVGPAPKGQEPVPAILVRAAGVRPTPDALPFVEELYPKFVDEAKVEALVLLARLPSPEAATAYLRLLRQHPSLASLPLGTLADEPRHPEILFPGLLEFTSRPALLLGVCEVASAFAEEGLLTSEVLHPYADRLADQLAARVELLEGRDLYQPKPEVAFEWRHLACHLLDLVAHAPTPKVNEVSRHALALNDPEVKAHAIVSLLKQGEPVGADVVEEAAAPPRNRLWLRRQLVDLDRNDLFPAQFATQQALAEAELWQWLSSPGILRDALEELAFAGMQTDLSAQGPARQYYLFRFRVGQPRAFTQKGWMAAWISYPANREPSLGGISGTRYTAWDALKPEGHIAEAANGLPSVAKDEDEGVD